MESQRSCHHQTDERNKDKKLVTKLWIKSYNFWGKIFILQYLFCAFYLDSSHITPVNWRSEKWELLHILSVSLGKLTSLGFSFYNCRQRLGLSDLGHGLKVLTDLKCFLISTQHSDSIDVAEKRNSSILS